MCVSLNSFDVLFLIVGFLNYTSKNLAPQCKSEFILLKLSNYFKVSFSLGQRFFMRLLSEANGTSFSHHHYLVTHFIHSGFHIPLPPEEFFLIFQRTNFNALVVAGL